MSCAREETGRGQISHSLAGDDYGQCGDLHQSFFSCGLCPASGAKRSSDVKLTRVCEMQRESAPQFLTWYTVSLISRRKDVASKVSSRLSVVGTFSSSLVASVFGRFWFFLARFKFSTALLHNTLSSFKSRQTHARLHAMRQSRRCHL